MQAEHAQELAQQAAQMEKLNHELLVMRDAAFREITRPAPEPTAYPPGVQPLHPSTTAGEVKACQPFAPKLCQISPKASTKI